MKKLEDNISFKQLNKIIFDEVKPKEKERELDIDTLKNGFTNIKIGQLSKETISILNLNRDVCDIILWEDRFKYIEKHKLNFSNEESFYKHIKQIPDIINNPDYIGKHPKDNSVQYIKLIDELMIVAIRIKDNGNLSFRTAYPLTYKQLDDYVKSGTAWQVGRNLL